MPPDDVLGDVERALIDHFGQRPLRASVSFVGVEPIEVLRFEPVPDERAYVSLGMARHPMTGAAETHVDADAPRAELVLHLRDPGDRFTDVWRRLAVLAAAPAVEGVVYADGMSVDTGEALVAGSGCTGVLVTASSVPVVDSGAGPVDVWRVIPAAAVELAWCRVQGAEALQQRWRDAGTDLLDAARSPVRLGD